MKIGEKVILKTNIEVPTFVRTGVVVSVGLLSVTIRMDINGRIVNCKRSELLEPDTVN